jgi:hypothetical protein
MDRVVSVGCKSWLWVCHVMRRLPDPSIERNSLSLANTPIKQPAPRRSDIEPTVTSIPALGLNLVLEMSKRPVGSYPLMGPAMPRFRFRTIQVCPKDCPSAQWQADREGIPGVYLRPKEIHHERADCTGSAGLGSRHRRNGALFGPIPPRHASVGIRSGLNTRRYPAGSRPRDAQRTREVGSAPCLT